MIDTILVFFHGAELLFTLGLFGALFVGVFFYVPTPLKEWIMIAVVAAAGFFSWQEERSHYLAATVALESFKAKEYAAAVKAQEDLRNQQEQDRQRAAAEVNRLVEERKQLQGKLNDANINLSLARDPDPTATCPSPVELPSVRAYINGLPPD